MAATSAAVRIEAPAPARRPQSRPRGRQQSHVRGGVLWIVLVAALLAGVVALNVAVLRLNVRSDKIGRDKVSLVAQNAALSSQISSQAAMGLIQDHARKRLGLVPAAPDKTVYVSLAH